MDSLYIECINLGCLGFIEVFGHPLLIHCVSHSPFQSAPSERRAAMLRTSHVVAILILPTWPFLCVM